MTWKKIQSDSKYSINEKGELRNDATGKYLKPSKNKNGYFYYNLWHNGKVLSVPIHRLLAEAFIPNPENKPTVDHKDGDRTNNDLSNLRWASYSEQNSRFDSYGVRSQGVTVLHYQEERKKRGGGHLSWGEVDEVLTFNRISDAAQYFGLSVGSISQLLKAGTIGRRGRTRGYRFLYTDSERITYS